MTRELGPLPKADRQDALQRESIAALLSLLPKDRFAFRDERADDKGVDGSLEILVGGAFTNCRAQVQLKSSDADPARPGAFNRDGSYSESIDTANLNYLLNGSSPVYVIWLSKLGELRYAWAHDEWRELDASKPGWMKRETFTIRFSRVLTTGELPAVAERVLGESRMHRRILESLARSAPAEDIVVAINAKTLASTDPRELHERLSAGGMTIVSSGYGSRVLEWYALLNPASACEPRLRLVAAYAAVSIAKYHEAKGYLAAAVGGLGDLSDDDGRFHAYLGAACDYHMGRMGREDYLKAEATWAGLSAGVQSAGQRLGVLRAERLAERSPARRAELLALMRTLAAEIESSPESYPPQRIQARLMVLASEGDDLSAALIDDLSRITLRESMGHSAASMTASAAKETSDRWEAWEERAAKLREDAVEVGHPLLTADVSVARVTAHVVAFGVRCLIAAGGGDDSVPPQAAVDALVAEAEVAAEVYRVAGSLEGEFRAKLLLADLYDFCGKPERAQALAREVLPVARAMNYEKLVATAQKHVDGNTESQQFRAAVTAKLAADEDAYALDMADEDVRSMARMTWEALTIPADRLRLVEKDAFAGRSIARERRDWCRHLELTQDLTHAQRPETSYATDPERACVCGKLGYASRVTDANYEAVIAAFKQEYCAGCAHRDAKRPTT